LAYLALFAIPGEEKEERGGKGEGKEGGWREKDCRMRGASIFPIIPSARQSFVLGQYRGGKRRKEGEGRWKSGLACVTVGNLRLRSGDLQREKKKREKKKKEGEKKEFTKNPASRPSSILTFTSFTKCTERTEKKRGAARILTFAVIVIHSVSKKEKEGE